MLDASSARLQLTCHTPYLFSFPVAQQGGFWSYIAGTVYRLIVAHEISPQGGGLEIDNHRTTLPMGKGLSSSAAVCVLVSVTCLSQYKYDAMAYEMRFLHTYK